MRLQLFDFVRPSGVPRTSPVNVSPRGGLEEADDVAGTFATDGALGFDPIPFLRALCEARSHAVVIGQVAGIMHGSIELTGDLDLL
ncbi:hypothetical protein [Streptomyces sp. NPDC001816]|uniref:hypothetical protein n=1 Tax=Streptomyces sp. NPDC001816 TaxID=3364612 RepID=UPI00368D6145